MNYPKLPSFRLDGKKALVTGAGRGIGNSARQVPRSGKIAASQTQETFVRAIKAGHGANGGAWDGRWQV